MRFAGVRAPHSRAFARRSRQGYRFSASISVCDVQPVGLSALLGMDGFPDALQSSEVCPRLILRRAVEDFKEDAERLGVAFQAFVSGRVEAVSFLRGTDDDSLFMGQVGGVYIHGVLKKKGPNKTVERNAGARHKLFAGGFERAGDWGRVPHLCVRCPHCGAFATGGFLRMRA